MKRKRERTFSFWLRLCAAIPLICSCLLSGCKPGPQPAYQLQLQRIAGGFEHPTSLAAPPDNSSRFFVTEQRGLIKIINPDGSVPDAPFLDLSSRMVPPSSLYDESGLLGLVFHPQYAQNGRFFVFYNAVPAPDTPAGYHSEVRLSEYRVSADDPDSADPLSEQVLLEVPHPQFNHNGGQLAFGPDGYLYVGIGDGGAANDVGEGHTPDLGNGQDLSKLLGKILRLDVSAPGTAAIPAGNPFSMGDNTTRGEIFAYGFRNPWRFSFDDQGRLFCGDVGQGLFEEIDIVTLGGNYGWNIKEGESCLNVENNSQPLAGCPDTGGAGEPLIDPVMAYSHTGDNGTVSGKAVIGGFVYRGSAIPALSGKYVFGDLSKSFARPQGSVFIGTETGGSWEIQATQVQYENSIAAGELKRYLLSFGQDQGGELYLLTSRRVGPIGRTGEVYKLAGAEILQ